MLIFFAKFIKRHTPLSTKDLRADSKNYIVKYYCVYPPPPVNF